MPPARGVSNAAMPVDVNPAVHDVLKRSGVLDVIGAHNVFPAMRRVLVAENMAWNAAQQQWLEHTND